jgi:hypothetical protein
MSNLIFGTGSGSTRKSPLSRAPFYSRFTDFEESGENYILIGFTPGLALQAAELNEIQDNFHKNLTLSNHLFSHWIPYVVDYMESNPSNLVTKILWDGVVPLQPSYIVNNGNNTITVKRGWYYCTHDSGLCYWVHLAGDRTKDISDILLIDSTVYYIGLKFDISDIFASSDERLYDNSSGSPNTVSPGAYRISKEIISIETSNSPTEYKNFLQVRNSSLTWLNTIPLGA